MEKYYSKIKPGLLLHIIVRLRDFKQDRIEVIEPDNFLQCAILRLDDGKTFRPHKHVDKDVTYETTKAQEGWIVIRGLIRCTLYDIDDTILATPYLGEGDSSFTLNGGHTFTVLEDNTFAYEIKSGPYFGQEKDKTFIE